MANEQSASANDDDPIIEAVTGVVDRLREHAEKPDAVLTCDDLLQLVGTRSHVLALLLFSMLNLLPAPPGYNFFMALIILALSIFLLTGREMHLGRFGKMRLPVGIVLKLLEILAMMARWTAKVSSPRWRGLVGSPAMPVFAVIAMVLGVAMLVPIPFTNMLPSIGLAMICVGILNQDGLLALLGITVSVTGVVITVVAIWIVVLLGLAIGGVIEDELDNLNGD